MDVEMLCTAEGNNRVNYLMIICWFITTSPAFHVQVVIVNLEIQIIAAFRHKCKRNLK